MPKPRHTDPLPQGEARDIGTDLVDTPDDLVSWDERKFRFSEVSINDVQIGPTDTAGFNSNPDLPFLWTRSRNILQLEPWYGPVEDHCAHRYLPNHREPQSGSAAMREMP